MKRALSFALLALLAGCGRDQPAPAAAAPGAPAEPAAPAAPASPAAPAQPANPAFVGKVWISTTRGAALGTMLIFLPDRTLVMDSCFETYRLTKWGVAGERIRWLEDTIPIEAAVEMPRPNQLILRVAGIDDEQSYMQATVPYTCPDMPK